ncbi:TPA: MerR family DNA-binding transcriptional regulator [Legionella pneumophila subsp. pneumophila]|nr:hypothetical protein DM454_11735 [Legionella pneumophila]HAT8881199.1 MerR family DNA-binding transcriptional regulator [Legionella pneumophila subsp. pneumophila]PYB48923.1 hypothetical protein DM456_12415 [Legionella pneumophila]PYB62012.1 hypothetical protein DM455_11685 [Legionella pneumophila]TID57977.1 hypothetical protein DIZ40_12840 [Legionella pneumophila]
MLFAIRLYERYGLIETPQRAPNGYRQYLEDVVDCLQLCQTQIALKAILIFKYNMIHPLSMWVIRNTKQPRSSNNQLFG